MGYFRPLSTQEEGRQSEDVPMSTHYPPQFFYTASAFYCRPWDVVLWLLQNYPHLLLNEPLTGRDSLQPGDPDFGIVPSLLRDVYERTPTIVDQTAHFANGHRLTSHEAPTTVNIPWHLSCLYRIERIQRLRTCKISRLHAAMLHWLDQLSYLAHAAQKEGTL